MFIIIDRRRHTVLSNILLQTMKHKNFENGSLHVVAAVVIFASLLALLGWAFLRNVDTSQKQDAKTTADNVSNVSQQKFLILSNWDVRLPLSTVASDLTTDPYSFTGDVTISSYGISIKGGSGCMATPDYVATISRVKSDVVITKPESPWTNTRTYDGYYGKTWSQFYQDQLAKNKTGAGLVKAVKIIDDYTYVLGYLPSNCGAPDSSTNKGRKIDDLRDERADELRSIFDQLESVAPEQV